ncbi:GNAT family N-acetyltransferase [Halpernia frigidisoli]|uniref:Acetyltransferase (GNAT) family protein n=1 Tax=Halpernia frigidisoli TaxID=1125876 RepID=A0A1I3CQ91_9FLAO|nr:GNAT family N-acetyltransferase [Halpernia frigidisoli]SFH76695.1 Acetyltransferase (GNAT) family protein [Halpernia frigidisoli]
MILRKANSEEIPFIWEILQHGIQQRKKDGSDQWQNGYPNEKTIQEDVANNSAYVFTDKNKIIAYSAIIKGIETAYNIIEGKWLNDNKYITIHRVAASDSVKGKGIGSALFAKIEDICLRENIYNIRVDTSFDNLPMIKILDKLNYSYCGEVIMGGSPRRAYHKELPKNI